MVPSQTVKIYGIPCRTLVAVATDRKNFKPLQSCSPQKPLAQFESDSAQMFLG